MTLFGSSGEWQRPCPLERAPGRLKRRQTLGIGKVQVQPCLRRFHGRDTRVRRLLLTRHDFGVSGRNFVAQLSGRGQGVSLVFLSLPGKPAQRKLGESICLQASLGVVAHHPAIMARTGAIFTGAFVAPNGRVAGRTRKTLP